MKRIALSRLPTGKQDYQEDVVTCGYTISKPDQRNLSTHLLYNYTKEKQDQKPITINDQREDDHESRRQRGKCQMGFAELAWQLAHF